MKTILWAALPLFSCAVSAETTQPINNTFVEIYGGGKHNRYIVSNLGIAGHGNRLLVAKGGVFKMKVDIYHNCPECEGAINQIIVGLNAEDAAQACLWIGGQSSDGWKTIDFQLNIPQHPGRYYIRTRYAQAYTCEDAKKWWKVDRPRGPTEAANIGYVRVR